MLLLWMGSGHRDFRVLAFALVLLLLLIYDVGFGINFVNLSLLLLGFIHHCGLGAKLGVAVSRPVIRSGRPI